MSERHDVEPPQLTGGTVRLKPFETPDELRFAYSAGCARSATQTWDPAALALARWPLVTEFRPCNRHYMYVHSCHT